MRVPIPKRKSGQTVIEFAFVSVIFIFMLVLTFNTVLAFSVYQYLSYVSFMAARAYQASGGSPAEQRGRAMETFHRYIPSLGSVNLSTNAAMDANAIVSFPKFRKELALIRKVYIPPVRENMDYGASGAMEQGAGATEDRYVGLEFEVPFAQFPLGEIAEVFGRITLSTRSFLGREVSQNECRTFFNAIGGVLGANGAFMEDQGC